MIMDAIRAEIVRALGALGFPGDAGTLEHPTRPEQGDVSSNAALLFAHKNGANPRDLARDLAAEISRSLPPGVARVDVAEPGFLNFFLSRDFFSNTVSEVAAAGDLWGTNTLFAGKKIMVEYTDPNPFKVFHIGHLMTNIIGESMARLFEFSGAEVKRANYQGDVGLHVAKALWAIRTKDMDPRSVAALGEAYAIGNSAYEEDTAARSEIIAINKKIYAKDPDILAAYTAGREASLAHFEELYALLGTVFDFYFFEGETWREGVRIVEDGVTQDIFEKSDGAVVFPGEKYGLHTRVFLTSEGLPTYEAKDVGLILAKKKAYDADTYVYVTAVEQAAYFSVIFKAIELLWPEFSGKLRHVFHGLLSLASGKMSSRKGNVVTGESLLRDSIAQAHTKMKHIEGRLDAEEEETARAVGVGALKYAILRQATGKNIIYDPGRSFSLEGDSGPYVQYAYVRARAVVAKAEREGVAFGAGNAGMSPEVPITDVERLLHRFPEVVERAAREYEPHYVTTYITEVASAFNSFYAREKIVGDDAGSAYRVAITQAVSVVLKNGLRLLGIASPERM